MYYDFLIWIAICKRIRQIISYHIGKRNTVDCQEFWDKVPKEYKESTLYSDSHEPYISVLKDHKYIGVGKETGLTNHIERWNNTIRQRLGRLTRKTLSFSKSEEMLEINLRIFIHNYNFEKGQKYLKSVISAN